MKCRSNSAGWQVGEARLIEAEDALPADDARGFVVDVRPAPIYGLVSRQAPSARGTSSYYLERALAPYSDRQVRDAVRVIRLDPQQIDLERMAGAQLLVIDHPGKLPADARTAAGQFRAAGPIAVVCGGRGRRCHQLGSARGTVGRGLAIACGIYSARGRTRAQESRLGRDQGQPSRRSTSGATLWRAWWDRCGLTADSLHGD